MIFCLSLQLAPSELYLGSTNNYEFIKRNKRWKLFQKNLYKPMEETVSRHQSGKIIGKSAGAILVSEED